MNDLAKAPAGALASTFAHHMKLESDARFVVVTIAEMLEPVDHHPRNDGDDDGSDQDLRIRQH